MIDILMILAAVLIVIGGLAALFMRSAFNKLIMLGILTTGGVLCFVKLGYLDAAIVVSLLMPVGTLFVLFLLGKKQDGKKEADE